MLEPRATGLASIPKSLLMNQFTISIVQLKIFGLLNDNLYPSFKLSDTVSLLSLFSAKLFIAIFGKHMSLILKSTGPLQAFSRKANAQRCIAAQRGSNSHRPAPSGTSHIENKLSPVFESFACRSSSPVGPALSPCTRCSFPLVIKPSVTSQLHARCSVTLRRGQSLHHTDFVTTRGEPADRSSRTSSRSVSPGIITNDDPLRNPPRKWRRWPVSPLEPRIPSEPLGCLHLKLKSAMTITASLSTGPRWCQHDTAHCMLRLWHTPCLNLAPPHSEDRSCFFPSVIPPFVSYY